ADFWRRVDRPGNTWKTGDLVAAQADDTMGVDNGASLAEYSESVHTTVPPLIVNCHMQHDWRRLFFGGPGVDKEGRIRHIQGALAMAQPGQAIILKGADWSDLTFQQKIASLQEQKQYESNGQTCYLPDDVQFYRASVGEGELASLYESSVERVTSPPKTPIVVNQCTLREWLNPAMINEAGYSVLNTALENQIQAGATVTITSPLSESLWFMLLNRLQTIGLNTGQKPKVFLVHAEGQPEQLG
ncbi:hypothetical protein, partial [Sansalvadorimonas verongulae]|uniref:hypothetical protein n=1 Tax=Sansalvadorimonas verongulae TaxID=2172824 RepID=UPI0018AD10CB